MARYSVQTASGRTYNVELAPGEDIESVVAEIERSEGVALPPAPSAGGGRGFVNPPMVGQPQPERLNPSYAPPPAPAVDYSDAATAMMGTPSGAPPRPASVLDVPAPPRDRTQEPGFMLRPEFVEQVRQGFARIAPEQRREKLIEMASGEGVYAQAAQRILADVQAEDATLKREAPLRQGLINLVANTPLRPSTEPPKPGKQAAPPPVAFPDVTPSIFDVGMLKEEQTQRALQRDTATRAVVGADTGVDAIMGRARKNDAEIIEAESRRRFAQENPLLGSLASGAAGLVSGTINIPSVAADAFNQTAVNPLLRALGMQELPRVPTAFGTEYLTKAASDFMPAVGRQEMSEAVKREEFAPWLMSKLAANSPQIAQSLAAAFVPPLRAALLPGMAGTAAGQSFVEGDDSRVAVAKGAVEYFSEKLPLDVFDKVGGVLKGMSPAKANTVLAIAGQRALQSGVAITANGLTNAVEEVAAQLGGNVLDKYFQGKDIELSKGLAEAAVVGGATGKLMSAPQVAAAATGYYEPERQIAREIDAVGGAFDNLTPGSAQAFAIERLRTERGVSNLISPAATVTNFTPPDSPTKAAGLVDIVVPLLDVPPGLPDVNTGDANVGTAGVPGGLAAAGGYGGGGLVGGSLGAAGPGLPVAAGGGGGTAQVPGAGSRQALPAGGAAGQQAPGLARPFDRASDADLLARTGAAIGEPLTWTGRSKTGYATEQDAEQAMATASDVVNTKQTHDWRVEPIPMGNGRFQLVGYPKETNLGTQATQAQQGQAPGAAATQAAGAAQGRVVVDSTSGLWTPQRPLPESELAGLSENAGADSVRTQAQQSLNRWAQAAGEAAPTLAKPDADAEAGVNVLGNLLGEATGLGQRVVAYSSPVTGESGFSIGGIAFVNTAPGVQASAPRTALHEIKHVAERLAAIDTKQGRTNTPAQQFVAQIDSIFDDMTDEGKRSYIENFLHKEELDAIADPAAREARLRELMASDKTRSEMTADFLGNRATDRGFLINLAKTDPQGFKGFVQKWLSVIDNLVGKLRGLPTQGKKESARVDLYVRDLNKAKMVARDALIAFRKGNLGLLQQEGQEQGQEPRFSIKSTEGTAARERTPLGFYSALGEGVRGLSASAAPARGWKDAIKGMVNKGQVKADEVEWSGVNDWLDLQQGRVTKEQVDEYLKQGGVRVEETVLGRNGISDADRFEWDDDATDNTKYGKYALPGGENYREVLLTLPEQKPNSALDDYTKELSDKYGWASLGNWREAAWDYNDLTDDEIAKLRQLQRDNAAVKGRNYQSSHWDQKNVLAHIRVNDRTDADGKRVLFVEELQSDFGADHRKASATIAKAVDNDFQGIVERMKRAGVLEVICD